MLNTKSLGRVSLAILLTAALCLSFPVFAFGDVMTSDGCLFLFRTNETVSSVEGSKDKHVFIEGTDDRIEVDAIIGFRTLGDNSSGYLETKIPADGTISIDPASLEISAYETNVIPTTVKNTVSIRTQGTFLSVSDLAAYGISIEMQYELDNSGSYVAYAPGSLSSADNVTSIKIRAKQTGLSERYDNKHGVYLCLMASFSASLNVENLTQEQKDGTQDINGFSYSFHGMPWQSIYNGIRYFSPTIEGVVTQTEVDQAGAVPTWDPSKVASGVTVNLVDSQGTTIATTTTDASGVYRFSNNPDKPGMTYAVSSAFEDLHVEVVDSAENVSIWNVDSDDAAVQASELEVSSLANMVNAQYDVNSIPTANWVDYYNSQTVGSLGLAKNSDSGRFILATEPLSTLSVSYDGNGNTGGTAPVDGTAYNPSDTVVIKGQGDLEKEGYDFLGWSTDPLAAAPDCEQGDEVTITGDLVYYAVWGERTPNPDPALTVRYLGNGHTSGSEPIDETEYSLNDEAVIKGKNDLARDGYDFLGWSSDPAATAPEVKEGDKVIVTDHLVYHAVWQRQTQPAPTDPPSDKGASASKPGALVRTGDFLLPSVCALLALSAAGFLAMRRVRQR